MTMEEEKELEKEFSIWKECSWCGNQYHEGEPFCPECGRNY